MSQLYILMSYFIQIGEFLIVLIGSFYITRNIWIGKNTKE